MGRAPPWPFRDAVFSHYSIGPRAGTVPHPIRSVPYAAATATRHHCRNNRNRPMPVYASGKNLLFPLVGLAQSGLGGYHFRRARSFLGHWQETRTKPARCRQFGELGQHFAECLSGGMSPPAALPALSPAVSCPLPAAQSVIHLHLLFAPFVSCSLLGFASSPEAHVLPVRCPPLRGRRLPCRTMCTSLPAANPMQDVCAHETRMKPLFGPCSRVLAKRSADTTAKIGHIKRRNPHCRR